MKESSSTIMLRGTRGCYVYACNQNLREYLRRFIQSENLPTAVPDLRFVEQMIEEQVNPSEKYSIYLPVYPLRAACGYFDECGRLPDNEEEGWIDASHIGHKLNRNMFVVHAEGKSMEPKIHDGDLCVFEQTAGSRNGKIVLCYAKDKSDPSASSYTIKKYTSEKAVDDDGVQHHTRITLTPLNPDYRPIVIDADEAEEGEFKIYGELIQVLSK